MGGEGGVAAFWSSRYEAVTPELDMKTVQRQDGAHGDGIWSVAWTNTSNTVVTASVDNTVKTWSGDTLEPVCVCTSRANDTIRRHAMGWDGDACWLLPLRLLCFACGSVWLQSTLLLSVDMHSNMSVSSGLLLCLCCPSLWLCRAIARSPGLLRRSYSRLLASQLSLPFLQSVS